MNPALLAGMGAVMADPSIMNPQRTILPRHTTAPIRQPLPNWVGGPTTGPGSGGEINRNLGQAILPTLIGQIGNIPGVPAPVRFAGDVLSQLLSIRPRPTTDVRIPMPPVVVH